MVYVTTEQSILHVQDGGPLIRGAIIILHAFNKVKIINSVKIRYLIIRILPKTSGEVS